MDITGNAGISSGISPDMRDIPQVEVSAKKKNKKKKKKKKKTGGRGTSSTAEFRS
jgi:hypothetical protein